MTRITLPKLVPSAATSTIATRINGSDSATSVRRMIATSIAPPKYPETRPSAVPSVPASTTANAATDRDVRAP